MTPGRHSPSLPAHGLLKVLGGKSRGKWPGSPAASYSRLQRAGLAVQGLTLESRQGPSLHPGFWERNPCVSGLPSSL